MPVSPLDFAENLLARARAIARSARDPDDVDDVSSDMLRAAWVMVGASIDTYFHERLRREILSGKMSKKAQQFDVPLGEMEEIIQSFIDNRTSARPRVRLKNAVKHQLSRMTFQGQSNIESAFAYLGIRSYWAAIADEMGVSVQALQHRLNEQYHRRNRIAHEGDYYTGDRPQAFKYYEITAEEVAKEIDWTREFLRSADLQGKK